MAPKCARPVIRIPKKNTSIAFENHQQQVPPFPEVLDALFDLTPIPQSDQPLLVFQELPVLRDLDRKAGSRLCQVLKVPRKCERPLGEEEGHHYLFYADSTIAQVYCCHNSQENEALYTFIDEHQIEQRKVKETDPGGQKPALDFPKPLAQLTWRYRFEELPNMEALSPRDANIQLRVKTAPTKSSKAAPVARISSKDKDQHPPPPPEEVREPPSSDRPNGAVYKIGRLLGKGGFAICYEGKLVHTKQTYAMKAVKSRMSAQKMEQKFQTELQIHSKMINPNIVKFYRAFTFQECTYIALELCPSGSLMDMVKKRKFITEPEVRFWTVQMAGAIKYMHGKGVIHRDLKMGNIFLDKNMNVKIGDFGLAAILVTGKELQVARRTTLCGTPNYIAPEILSKDKSGHDHAVDIWSLGIIIFAMLTGKPPFQSAVQEEIYRRARERDYDWPKSEEIDNHISDATKDLIEQLLRTPEERPSPDVIVQHDFFTCGWLPQSEDMVTALRDKHPEDIKFRSQGVATGKEKINTRSLKKLCIKCEVGPWTTNPKRLKSAYRECAAEETAGLTPVVPLPDDIVYRPFHEWLEEQSELVSEAEVDELSSVSSAVAIAPDNGVSSSHIRAAPQSFAAQQRARPALSLMPNTSRSVNRTSSSESSRPMAAAPMRKPSARKTQIPEAIPEPTADVEGRLAADVVNQFKSIKSTKREMNPEFKPHRIIVNSATEPSIKSTRSKMSPESKSHKSERSLATRPSIFSSQERLEALPQSHPDIILERLRKLQVELERALNSRSISAESTAPETNGILVVKWVDYTNKFGLGYILSNGSVGCIFKESAAEPSDPSAGILPTSCLVVRKAEYHLRNRSNPAYVDRYEVVPSLGPGIEFYEHTANKGILGTKIDPKIYKLAANESKDAPKKPDPAANEWDRRRRSNLVLWKKFANYMVAYGRDQSFYSNEGLEIPNTKEGTAANVVTFYQRWGDVGCWFFGDGHFQFNFPDHTKIVISADGTWCNFFHLSMEAARDLELKGTMAHNALDNRTHLSQPLQTLLNFMAKPARTGRTYARKRPEIDPMIQGIPQANDFRRKIEFVVKVIKEWVANGGIGKSDMSPEGRLRWQGRRELVNVEIPYKHVWASVGGHGTDERCVSLFDPRKPNEITPDIEG